MPIIAEDNIILKIIADTKKAKKGINDLDDRVDKLDDSTGKVNKSFAKLGKIAAAAISVAVIYKATKAMAGLVKRATEAYGEFEKTATSFEVLVGSITKAKDLIKELTKFSSATPFSSQEVQASAKTLLSFGRNTKETIQDINNLGEVAAATGADLNQLAFNYGKVASQGKLTGLEVKSFIVSGIPVYDLLEKSLGKSTEELQKMQAQGKITFKDLEKAISDATTAGGKFEGALKKQANTLQGIISTYKSNVDELMITIGEKFAPAFKSFYRLMNEVFILLNKNANEVDNDWVLSIAAALDAATENLDSFSHRLSTWVQLSIEQFRLFARGIDKIEVTLRRVLFKRDFWNKSEEEKMKDQALEAQKFVVELLRKDNEFYKNINKKGFADSYRKALAGYRKELAADGKTGNPIIDGMDPEGGLGGVGGKGGGGLFSASAIDRIVKSALKAYAQIYTQILSETGSFTERSEGQFKEAKLFSVFLAKDIAKYTAQELRNFQKYVQDELGEDSILDLVLQGYVDDAEGKEIDLDLVDKLMGPITKAIADYNKRQGKGDKKTGWLQSMLGLDDTEMAGFNEASNVLLQSARNLTNDLLSEEVRRTDLLIAASRDRLAEFQRIAGEGNAEQLQLEEERQRTLLERREDYLQKQRRLNALEITANNAVIVSNMIVGLAKAFKAGNVIGGIVYSLAAAATIAATIASVNAAISNAPSFETGTDFVQGDGGIDNVNAKLNRGERVVDKRKNATLTKWGVTNDDLIPLVGMALGKYQPANIGKSNVVSQAEFKKLEKGLSEVKQAIYGIQFNVNIDPDGIGVAAGNYMANKQKVKNLMS